VNDPVNPQFKIHLTELQRLCSQSGVNIVYYCTIRSCSEQAKLFRRSRTEKEISQRAQSLADRGYPFLAESLLSVGPQPGKLGAHVTNAGPGESFHQYGMAADGAPFSGGKPIWDESAHEWHVYGESARYLGLTWAGDWTSFKEYPHVQLVATRSPLTHFKSAAAVEAALRACGSL
jgi:peptidoglycan LD-endopeptidase CwlK